MTSVGELIPPRAAQDHTGSKRRSTAVVVIPALDALLSDGSVVQVRSITPADAERLRQFHAALSPETTRLRFFAPHPRLSEAEVTRFVTVDGRDRVALVAVREERIAAVARYERVPGNGAEVAFVVADELQGRGIGSLLLEHLAAIARTVGCDHLVANTLSDNRGMLDVFRHAGLPVTTETTRGEVMVRLMLTPTELYHQAVEEREWSSRVSSLRRLLRPRAVAVIGAGRRPDSIGNRIAVNLHRGGFTGPIYPVNPHGGEIAGDAVLGSIAELPPDCDLAIIAVPAAHVAAVASACGERGVGGLVVVSSGFAEIGAQGAMAEFEVVRAAHAHGMRVIGPNCMGILNTALGLDATFATVQANPGNIGFASQSGAMGIALLERAAVEGLGLSTFVSLGNKADVSSNDLLRYWDQDADTKVVLLYLESLGNPRAFARIARRVSMHKPIVALKSGRSTAGARAASSHTAALAGSDTAVDTLLAGSGVIRVRTLEELIDTAALLSTQPLPGGNRVGVLSNAGGAAILAADACSDAGLTVPELSSVTRALLRLTVDPASATNPVDLGAEATPERFEAGLHVLLDDDDIDMVVAICASVPSAPAGPVSAAMEHGAAGASKPVALVLLGAAAQCRPGLALPRYAFPENAVAALGRSWQHARWRSQPPDPVEEGVVDVATAAAVVTAAALHRDGWMRAEEVQAVLAAYGIAVPRWRQATTLTEAEAAARVIGYPLALKAEGAALLHKSEHGGVALDIGSQRALRAAWRAMRARLGDRMHHATLQQMVPGDVELIVGGLGDAASGPMVMVGSGGVTAELSGDRAFAMATIGPAGARELLNRTRAGRLLDGYRGRPRLARAAVEALVCRVGRLMADRPEITELDLNPVTVDVTRAVAVDARIRVTRTQLAGLPVRKLDTPERTALPPRERPARHSEVS